MSYIYQTADQPGSNIVDSDIPQHECNIDYRQIPGSTFWPVGLGRENSSRTDRVTQNFPNPVKGMTSFNIILDKPATVTIEVSNLMGQVVMSMDKGIVTAGIHKYSLDAHQLAPGVYFYSVKIGSETYTHKMIVE